MHQTLSLETEIEGLVRNEEDAMLLRYSSRWLPACITLIIIAGSNQMLATIEGVKQADSPKPFYAEYKVRYYTSLERVAADNAEAVRIEKQTYREYIAKGYSEERAKKYAESLGKAMQNKEVLFYTQVFGSDGISRLFGYKLDNGNYSVTAVNKDQVHFWDTWTERNKSVMPVVRVAKIDPKSELQQPTLRQEAVIFGFEPLEGRIFADCAPTVTKRPNGDVVISSKEDATKESPSSSSDTVVLDKDGRFVSSIYTVKSQDGIITTDTWKVSDYIQVKGGWLPKVIKKAVHEDKKLTSSREYNLDRLETDGQIFKRWFGDTVPAPAFVEDRRFGSEVRYFTRRNFLPDNEVKQRAMAASAGKEPNKAPIQPLQAGAVMVALAGIVLIIRNLGWSKQPKEKE